MGARGAWGLGVGDAVRRQGEEVSRGTGGHERAGVDQVGGE